LNNQASTAGNAISATPPAAEPRSALSTAIALLLTVVVPVTLWFIPTPMDPLAQHALAVGSFMIGAWITHALDHGIAGIIGCYLFWTLGIAKFQSAFSGFAETTPWFLFGAILFGLMATKSGLARRLAYWVMRAVGHSYSRLLLGLMISDFLLTILVPSGIARVVIMAAIAMGLIDAFGVGRGSNIARGMFIILVYTATIFDKMIIAGAASITARGLIERVGEVHVLWSQWFLAFLPCDILTVIAAWRLTLWLYPPEQAVLPGGASYLSDELKKMGPLSTLEIKAGLLMLMGIVLWMTDFVHHIPSPMIGIGIGLLAVVPKWGLLEAEDVRRINFLPIFFVASAISLSHVLAESGALNLLTGVLFGWMTPYLTGVWSSTFVLYWSAFFYHIIIGDEISMLATSLPVLMTHAKTHGLDPLILGMIWTFGAGAKVFIYQSAVLVVGYSYGFFETKDMFKVGLILTVIEFFILLLLAPIFWPLIGL
jgi:solute carrier family 13 (sodium-dependent dicarboxylate transporter), member 2/3/5